MIYKTRLTSKGTTTIPKVIRDQLGVEPGMLISFQENESTGEYVLARAKTINEVRSANKQALKKTGTAKNRYTSGLGYTAHTKEKLG